MEQNLINKKEYKLKVRKHWVKATEQWHIEFINQTDNETRFEIFLTDPELEQLRRVL